MFQTLSVDRETRGYYLNRTKASVNTAIYAIRLQTQQAGLVGPMGRVELELLDERAKSHDPDAVEAKIRQKFEAGGYGQFSRKFLDVYVPDLSDEGKKITIGHQEPLFANTDDDFEDGEAVGEW
jgi:hypothetical protein